LEGPKSLRENEKLVVESGIKSNGSESDQKEVSYGREI